LHQVNKAVGSSGNRSHLDLWSVADLVAGDETLPCASTGCGRAVTASI
jgi:hypothetical protein